jgi:serine/threonine-protein kinase 24/25/MST4
MEARPPQATPSATGAYEVLHPLGAGAFGQVFKGVRKISGDVVAIKVINLEEADDEIETIQQEIAVLAQCQSPYVTKYIESFVHGPDLWIVMEFLAGGSVASVLATRRLEEVHIATICRGMLLSLEYLHTQGKLHRDIKAANVLLAESGEVKLADFGVSGQLVSTASKRNTLVGTPYWMAPEVIQGCDYDQTADMWSLGITAYEMATGKPPNHKEHAMRALFLIPRNDPPRLKGRDWSEVFKDFVAACLQKDPRQRPSATAMLQSHAFVRDANPCSTLRAIIPRVPHTPSTTPPRTPPHSSSGAMALTPPEAVELPAPADVVALAAASAMSAGQTQIAAPVWDFGGLAFAPRPIADSAKGDATTAFPTAQPHAHQNLEQNHRVELASAGPAVGMAAVGHRDEIATLAAVAEALTQLRSDGCPTAPLDALTAAFAAVERERPGAATDLIAGSIATAGAQAPARTCNAGPLRPPTHAELGASDVSTYLEARWRSRYGDV